MVMDESAFYTLLSKLQPWTDYLYFHLMGEPLCHPNLAIYLTLADTLGFRVILTTNGTLLHKQEAVLLQSPALHKINISLHAFEANDIETDFDTYLDRCFLFGQKASGKLLVVYRLWNNGGADLKNPKILERMKAYFPEPWVTERQGTRISHRIYLQYGEKFDWPDINAVPIQEKVRCYGLRDQIGVLCDGTVVPCCLDHNGDLPLGNLLKENMEDILSAPRSQALYNTLKNGTCRESLCRRCGFSQRFR